MAKKLPNLPRGVDPTNLRVIACVRRIAAEAGELCASDTIAEGKEQVRGMLAYFFATASCIAGRRELTQEASIFRSNNIFNGRNPATVYK